MYKYHACAVWKVQAFALQLAAMSSQAKQPAKVAVKEIGVSSSGHPQVSIEAPLEEAPTEEATTEAREQSKNAKKKAKQRARKADQQEEAADGSPPSTPALAKREPGAVAEEEALSAEATVKHTAHLAAQRTEEVAEDVTKQLPFTLEIAEDVAKQLPFTFGLPGQVGGQEEAQLSVEELGGSAKPFSFGLPTNAGEKVHIALGRPQGEPRFCRL